MHLVKQDSLTGKLRAFPEQYSSHHCVQSTFKLHPVFWQTGRFIDLVDQLACWLIDELHWR